MSDAEVTTIVPRYVGAFIWSRSRTTEDGEPALASELPLSVARTITGFHLDADGDWVAELSCWHNQHVRHRPPFFDRPWVLEDATRTDRIGTELDCPLCLRGELPEGLVPARKIGPFDESNVPPALLQVHELPLGRWAVLRIEEGTARLVFHSPPTEVVLSAGEERAIPPALPHHLVASGHFRGSIQLLVRVLEGQDP